MQILCKQKRANDASGQGGEVIKWLGLLGFASELEGLSLWLTHQNGSDA